MLVVIVIVVVFVSDDAVAENDDDDDDALNITSVNPLHPEKASSPIRRIDDGKINRT